MNVPREIVGIVQSTTDIPGSSGEELVHGISVNTVNRRDFYYLSLNMFFGKRVHPR